MISKSKYRKILKKAKWFKVTTIFDRYRASCLDEGQSILAYSAKQAAERYARRFNRYLLGLEILAIDTTPWSAVLRTCPVDRPLAKNVQYWG